ncbi:hypothetical protein EDC23_0767 [Thiohalophilus thiocyanatoxydans]|uniref:Uncharacterized protein n=1 Tax=Thiohalophilus thiocyanatoxydans TaxID=381308 RepID=A0A4R8IX99_9GAMM|nr:hypothetical protein EDC23_0767 [Thiohalophilus thiocyanatoxydans]
MRRHGAVGRTKQGGLAVMAGATEGLAASRFYPVYA